eukprot:822191_1
MATNEEENQTQEPATETNAEAPTETVLKEEAPSSPSIAGDGDTTATATASKHKTTQSREMIAQAAANTTDHLLKELAFARCLFTFVFMSDTRQLFSLFHIQYVIITTN